MINILVVDDDPMNLKMAEFILKQKEYYRVKLAKNGREALAILDEDPTIDLVLLDIEMPYPNGFETLQLIRDNPATLFLKVVFLTASSGVEDVQKAAELGAVGYVKKPFMPQDLLEHVEKALVADF
ncbi:MAG: response regulator [Lachnospiraceae bacterium]|nr:response regulator [Lachnospiraceae bacterium]MBQ2576131.1 response regulator [Lachnospiraceae bacterium]MEE3354710.1 response regulator [Candidatus Weimeria sp.]